MKYRSYNSELLIATTLMCDVFNDIIIDRRKHGLKRDYSKPITLGEIVQQKIEVPCILGDRGIILKSLENEPGKYRLPLIIIQMKDLKTDVSRMSDIHADIFYQQDERFSSLDYEDKLYRPQELSKRRGQPVSISYDVTFITKYKEDLDQIISNFIVHFRPDIYLKWWHPRNKKDPLTSQILWTHNISFDSGIDYNPQNSHVYKGTTSFTFKSWLFFGMNATDNAIDPNLESIIKHITLFPDKDNDDNDNENNGDDTLLFDNNNDYSSGLKFLGTETSQEFIGTDSEKMKNGQYIVNNIYSEKFDEIKNDKVISNIKNNKFVGDIIANKDDIMINEYKKYQEHLLINDKILNNKDNAFVKNVYFKGSFPESSFYLDPPSGDYMFRTFFSEKQNSYEKNKKLEFGSAFFDKSKIIIDYNIDSKDFILSSVYDSNSHYYDIKSIFNSESGYKNEFNIKSKKLTNIDEYIEFGFKVEYDTELNKIKEKENTFFKNIKFASDYIPIFKPELFIDNVQNKLDIINLKNIINGHWNSIDLMEIKNGEYELILNDRNLISSLKHKNLLKLNFNNLKLIKILHKEKMFYHILANHYIYVILMIDSKTDEVVDVYDHGILYPFNYLDHKALVYEVTIPESKEVLGLNFILSL